LDFLNKNPILQKEIPLYLTTEVNENDNTQEFESKFLNYELGVSDKVSTIYDILDESIKEKEIIKKECEKSVEEIEKIAKEIYNSNIKRKSKKSKKIVNLKKNKILNNFNLNCDIDELKDGEEINDILTFTINNSSKIKEN
jgi:chloramphenicol O-acetyltransferase